MTTEQLSTIKTSVKRLPNSRAEISVSIPAEIFDRTRSKAIAHLGEHVELQGFRKGKVPEKILETRLGEAAILEEMAEITIGKAYPIILEQEKLDAIGSPRVRLTKIARGNPLEAVIETDIFPELVLPDYRKIASGIKEEAVDVSDDEVEKTVTEIRKVRGKHLAEETGKTFDEEQLPELDDTFVKTLGDFASVPDFRAKLKENIVKEKGKSVKEKRRVAIVEGILGKLRGDIPELFVEQELLRMEDEFRHDIERMGMKFDDYLKQLGKTHEDLRKDWRTEAEKRAKVQLMITEIGRKESIVASEEEVETEVNKLHILYPNTPIERIKSYVDMVLTNEKVFKFLESSTGA